jgi:hypothetical protein
MYVAGPAGALAPPFEVTRSEWNLLRSIHEAPRVESVVSVQGEREREAALKTISRALSAGLFDVQLK